MTETMTATPFPTTVPGLLAAATATAGLDDFGDRHFLTGLSRLVGDLPVHARLNGIGGQMVYGGIINLLVNRLRYVRDVQQHPEILQEKIEQPIVILGLPRTGTTKLQRVMSADPQVQRLDYWRQINPAPFPGEDPGHPKERIDAALAVEQLLTTRFPGWMARHPTEALEPDEELHLMHGSFECIIPWLFARTPDYYRYVMQCDPRPMYRHLYAQMQYLQWQDGGGRGRPWIMKSPCHTGSVDTLLEVFPDAVLVHCHRDIQKILPSIAALIEEARRIHSDHCDRKILGEEMLDYWGRSVDRYLQVRETLPAERILDLPFEQVVNDVVGAIGRIYAKAGRAMTSEAVAAFREYEVRRPDHHFGSYSYSAADYGYTAEQIDERFAAYRERFITRSAESTQETVHG